MLHSRASTAVIGFDLILFRCSPVVGVTCFETVEVLIDFRALTIFFMADFVASGCVPGASSLVCVLELLLTSNSILGDGEI